ncbi:MAG: hypothetical protein ACREXW_20470, partial [Gammaproteobacteria bacterium]
MTLLLFLKMADHLTEEPYNPAPFVPLDLGWKALLPLDGAALEDHYRKEPGKARCQIKRGILGVIFKGARCEIHNPALLILMYVQVETNYPRPRRYAPHPVMILRQTWQPHMQLCDHGIE